MLTAAISSTNRTPPHSSCSGATNVAHEVGFERADDGVVLALISACFSGPARSMYPAFSASSRACACWIVAPGGKAAHALVVLAVALLFATGPRRVNASGT